MPELAPEGRRAGAIELSIEPEGCRGRGAMALMPSGVARRTSSGEADSQEGPPSPHNLGQFFQIQFSY